MKETMLNNSEGVKARAMVMENIMNGMETLLNNLYGRWMDEKEYEDFNDYKKVMIEKLKEVSPNTKVVSVGKRPFGMKIKPANFPYTVSLFVNNSSYGWKPVKKS